MSENFHQCRTNTRGRTSSDQSDRHLPIVRVNHSGVGGDDGVNSRLDGAVQTRPSLETATGAVHLITFSAQTIAGIAWPGKGVFRIREHQVQKRLNSASLDCGIACLGFQISVEFRVSVEFDT